MNIAEQIKRAKADLDAAHEAGMKAEYDRFWDAYQDYGKRDYYPGGFCGPGWSNKEIFKPKYPIVLREALSSATSMFLYFGREKEEIFDFTDICKMIDFSKIRWASSVFMNACGRNITCDFSNCEQLSSTFAISDGGNLDNIYIKVSEKAKTFNSTFLGCLYLTEFRFLEGSVVAGSGLSFQWSPLSHDSIVSVINALSNTTSGLSVGFSKSAVNKAFETSAGAADGSTSAEWQSLIATKNNWTISLV